MSLGVRDGVWKKSARFAAFEISPLASGFGAHSRRELSRIIREPFIFYTMCESGIDYVCTWL